MGLLTAAPGEGMSLLSYNLFASVRVCFLRTASVRIMRLPIRYLLRWPWCPTQWPLLFCTGPSSWAQTQGCIALVTHTPAVHRPIILGTDTGSLLELVLDERALQQKKEPHPKPLLQLTTPGSRLICGVRQVWGNVSGHRI